ncbi:MULTISPECIES: phosphate signaling complex PhoU family protein [Halomicrobium]|uniref:Phosphate uptake regulator, PhoU n=2 Tax=Halomicrobium mukohataei TaxID=57705 RepID=C7NXQ2_HALMD|nr:MULTISPECIES: phosphate uptake regulator PhoU [Halomicrobium]ACV46490.1 phosphate uptake regulator, PhoU [Halomicrobium mukohataei DSM 12286]QCD65036.1 phosphate uptake regulator PhoU [Halomicrobium mukohataei]QFR19842.1 phosphate uptake regulator PhoU [Halomicrobium sp. ZPS1]
MDSRKIQTVGGGTYTVSLPKSWAREQSLEAGSVVDLHTHVDGVLVVEARETDDGAGRVEVAVEDQRPVHLEQTLRAAYAAGASTVRFEAAGEFTDAQSRRIQSVTRTMTGVTIDERTAAQITVQSLVDAAEVSIPQSVRQLAFVALSMHRDATAALDGDGGPDIADRDDQADRLAAMVDRHFGRALARLDEVDALGQRRPELLDCWRTACELERVADHAERIATTAAALEAPPAESVDALTDLAQRARTVVEDGVGVVVDRTAAGAARDVLDRRDGVRERATAIERRLVDGADGDYRLVRVLDSLRRTAEHGGNIAEAGLRGAVRRGDHRDAFHSGPEGSAVDAASDAGS